MDVDPEFWHGRRVLVTGHTGFKGAWLSLWLASMGAEVIGFAADAPADGPALFSAARIAGDLAHDVRGDVRDLDAVRRAVGLGRPEVVFHLAAQALVRPSYRDPVETYATNVMGTVHVLEAVRHTADVRAVVVATSDKCYDDRGYGRPYVESDPMGGHDPYAGSKGAAELAVASYRRSYFRGVGATRVASVRAGNVIGGGDWNVDRLIPDVIRGVYTDATIRLRHPGAVRPWQHVLDALSGYLVLGQALCAGVPNVDTAFNFGPPPGDTRSVQAIVDGLATRMPRALTYELDDAPSVHEAEALTLDSTRARVQLDWRPRWGLDEALDAVVEWFVAHDSGADMHAETKKQLTHYRRSRRGLEVGRSCESTI